MQIIDATPPADFPKQVVVLNRHIAQRDPNKAFYLRVANAANHNVNIVDLDGAVTVNCALRIAKEKGYNPTHWMESTDPFLFRFH